MRGKAVGHDLLQRPAGITPACAGKRCDLSGSFVQHWDHPRMCGEKRLPSPALCTPSGSPPHVRGKVMDAVTRIRNEGITPACAGKRTNLTGKESRGQDHPRMCGEKVTSAVLFLGPPGSPPHVRGKESTHQISDHFKGITPACAGKSLLRNRC